MKHPSTIDSVEQRRCSRCREFHDRHGQRYCRKCHAETEKGYRAIRKAKYERANSIADSVEQLLVRWPSASCGLRKNPAQDRHDEELRHHSNNDNAPLGQSTAGQRGPA